MPPGWSLPHDANGRVRRLGEGPRSSSDLSPRRPLRTAGLHPSSRRSMRARSARRQSRSSFSIAGRLGRLHRGGGRSRVIHVEMRASGRAENPSRQGFIQPAGFVRRNAQEVPGLQGLLSRLWRLLGRPFCPFLACRRAEAGGLRDGPAFAPLGDGARAAWRGTWALLAGLNADLGHERKIGLALAVTALAGVRATAPALCSRTPSGSRRKRS